MTIEHVYPTAQIISIYYNAGWHDISNDVVSEIEGFQGITGTDPTDKVGSVGHCSMVLDNVTGKYTPGGSNMIDNEWGRGIPLRVDITFLGVTENVFWGRVEVIELDTSDFGPRNVAIRALDYMNIVSLFPLKAKALETNKRMDEAVQSLLDDLPIAPQNTELSEGISTFPTVFDDIKSTTRAASEFQKLALSEVGYIYIGIDDTVIAEARDDRKGNREPAKFVVPDVARILMEDGGALLQEDGDDLLLDETESTFDNTMQDIEMRYGEGMINEAHITAFPRAVGEDIEVLFSLDKPFYIPGFEKITLKGKYADPDGGAQVWGTGMINPVAPPDYLLNADEDGGGADYTAFLTVTATFYSDGVEFEFYTAVQSGWLTKCNARGYKISKYNPIEVTARDTVSADAHGVNSISIKQKYQDNPLLPRIEADRIVENEREPDTEAISVTFLANSSQLEMLAFLNLQTGDLVHIKEDYNEVDLFYYIYSKTYEITQGGIIHFTYSIKRTRSLQKGLTDIAIEFSGPENKEMLKFPATEEVMETAKTIVMEIYITDWTIGAGILLLLSDKISLAGTLKFMITSDTNKALLFNSNEWDALEGRWQSAANVLVKEVWYTASVSYDSENIYNRPLFYVDGAQILGTTTLQHPHDALRDRLDTNTFFIGAQPITPTSNVNEFHGIIKNVRYYNRMLRDSEHLLSVTDVVQDGLIFQAPNVVTKRLADYVDQALGENDKLIDNIYGVVGTPLFSPTGREA